MKTLNTPLHLMGYVENGTGTAVEIFQDDATREYIAVVGKKSYCGTLFQQALDAEATDGLKNHNAFDEETAKTKWCPFFETMVHVEELCNPPPQKDKD